MRERTVQLQEPAFKSMSEVYLEAIEELALPHPATHLPDWPTFNKFVGGLRSKEFTILCGSTGCLSGETLIRVNRSGKGFTLTMRDLYLRTRGIATNKKFDLNIPTYVRSYNGIGIKLHKIKDVHLSGIKETWEFRFSGNKRIRTTPSHKILTERGFVELQDLKHGDLVAVDNPYTKRKTTRDRKHFRDTYFSGVKFHPYSTVCNEDRRIVKHRAIYEANANGLSLEEFLRVCRWDREAAQGLIFVNPKTHHIHHKNHDHHDNAPDNLEALPVQDHLVIHGNEQHFGAGTVQWVKFLSSGLPGVESVYDIECEEPYHNFSAQGLIVHNSGKTTLLANLSAQLLKISVKHFVMSVETGHADYMKRVLSVLAGEDLNTGDAVPADKLKALHAANAKYLESNNIEFSLYDNRVSVEQLIYDLEFMQARGCKLAFVDNLNFFMEVVGDSHQVVEMDRTVHELVMFCKRVDMHVVLVMHPKKTHGGLTRVDNEFDIKGSSTSVQESTNVWLFNRPKDEDVKAGTRSRHERELTLQKLRRRGRYSRSTIVFKSVGTRYVESGFFD